MADLTTPRPWTLAAGQLPRIVQRGYGVSVCGLHKIGRGEKGEAIAVANGRLILGAVEMRDDLVRSLQDASDALQLLADTLAGQPDHDPALLATAELVRRQSSAVLAKARGEG